MNNLKTSLKPVLDRLKPEQVWRDIYDRNKNRVIKGGGTFCKIVPFETLYVFVQFVNNTGKSTCNHIFFLLHSLKYIYKLYHRSLANAPLKRTLHRENLTLNLSFRRFTALSAPH